MRRTHEQRRAAVRRAMLWAIATVGLAIFLVGPILAVSIMG